MKTIDLESQCYKRYIIQRKNKKFQDKTLFKQV